MAGALSEQGENIDEIERLSTEARKNIRKRILAPCYSFFRYNWLLPYGL